MCLTICLFSACHDKLWDAIDDLDVRVARLEELCKEMNTNIVSIQTIVNVVQSGDYITGVTEIKKDSEVIGYTITFANHDPITIYHGQDGKDGADGKDGQDGQNGSANAPVIGVAQDTDGVYYWTLNGEWLLDDNGNKLPVSGKDGQNGTNGTNGSNGQDGADGKDGQDGEDGKDGKDGITPQLKIEDGYWYISYDNGATWTQLGKATGEDGKDGTDGEDGKDGQNGTDGKDGQDGDSMFQSVTQDENYVYFTLADGTVIKIAKGTSSDNQPSNEDIIVFRDLAIKSALLKLGVDTTGDGEISYGEAASYNKNLTIKNNEQIHSFKEFKFFTSISSFNYEGCSNLFELELPNGITTIEKNAFNSCTSLAVLSIPNTVKNIGARAFSGCHSLNSIYLPNSVETIGSSAFSYCFSLSSITIPEKITSLEDSLFHYCSKLAKINFSNNIVSVGSQVFSFCSALESIVLPNSVKNIGEYAFAECENLRSLTFPENLKTINHPIFSISTRASSNDSYHISTIYWNAINYEEEFRYIYKSGYNTYYYPGLGYTDYGDYTSSGLDDYNSTITKVVFGEKTQVIPSYLCCRLNSINEIVIPNSVVRIESYAFLQSTVATVRIGNGVTSIGSGVFDGCYKLQYIYCSAITPPILGSSAIPTSVGIIYVPRESVEEYRALWNDFANKIAAYDFE